MSEIKICCPKCKWEPDGGEYWQCDCGHVWDTFKTIARCPACHKQHQYTACVPHAGGCEAHSPHLDWYEGLDKIIEDLKEEVLENQEVFI